jgi:hypothetical protein
LLFSAELLFAELFFMHACRLSAADSTHRDRPGVASPLAYFGILLQHGPLNEMSPLRSHASSSLRTRRPYSGWMSQNNLMTAPALKLAGGRNGQASLKLSERTYEQRIKLQNPYHCKSNNY